MCSCPPKNLVDMTMFRGVVQRRKTELARGASSAKIAGFPPRARCESCRPPDKCQTLKVLETFRVSLLFNAKIHAEMMMYGKKV
jgi:hypothetical protein